MNCGVGGTSAGDWNNSTGTGLFGDEVSKVAGTSLTFISIGVNDQGNGSPTSAYQNNYQTLVSRLSAYSDVVAMPPFYVGTTDVSSVNSDLNSYRDAIRDNVVGYNKFIDMRSKMQELNIPYANFSNQHPTFTGYRMIADLLWNEMLR
jgi:lysophospholipase L1-like esterase